MFPHGSSSFEPVFIYEDAIRRKQLNAMIACVGNHNLSIRIAGDIPRIVELPIATAFLPECQDKSAVKFENLK